MSEEKTQKNDLVADPIRKVDPSRVEILGENATHQNTKSPFGGHQGFRVPQMLGAFTIPFVLIFVLLFGVFALIMATLFGRKVSKNVFFFKR